MARKSVEELLNRGNYQGILDIRSELGIENIRLILNHPYDKTDSQIITLGKLIEDKVIPELEKIKENGQLEVTLDIGRAYKIGGDCYEAKDDNKRAKKNFETAEENGVDCTQELEKYSKPIEEYLKEYDYKGILKYHPDLSAEEAKLIVEHIFNENTIKQRYNEDNKQEVNDLINLIFNEVYPILQDADLNERQGRYKAVRKGKRLAKFTKNHKSASGIIFKPNPQSRYKAVRKGKGRYKITKHYKPALRIVSSQTRTIAQAFKILGDCYMCRGDEGDKQNAKLYYSNADKNGINCKEEKKPLIKEGKWARRRAEYIQKYFNNKAKEQDEKDEVAFQYAVSIMEERLQATDYLLSDDAHRSLLILFILDFRGALYMRKVDKEKEDAPANMLCSTFEKIFKELFYIPYAVYLDKYELENDSISQTCKRLRNNYKLENKTSFKSYSHGFTMGNIYYLMVDKDEYGKEVVDPTFYNFITKKYKTNIEEECFLKLADDIETFRKDRNNAAHGESYDYEVFTSLCEDVFEKETLIVLMVKMTNGEFLKPDEDLYDIKISNELLEEYSQPTGVLQDKCKQLEAAEFVWDATIRFDYETFYSELMAYKEEFGDLLVPHSYINEKTGYKLGKVTTEIRRGKKALDKRNALSEEERNGVRRYEGIFLTEDKYKQLDDVRFVWDAKRFDYEEFCKELMAYREEFGDLLVPLRYINETTGYKLGQTVSNIRKGKRAQNEWNALSEEEKATTKKPRMILQDEKYQELTDAGFVWDATPFTPTNFKDKSDKELMTSKEDLGNLEEPASNRDEKTVSKLGQIVNNIKSSVNNIKSSAERKIFDYEKRKQNRKWFNDFCQELDEYVSKFGGFKGVKDDKVLGPKVKTFIESYNLWRHGQPTELTITDKMLSKLEEIGFIKKSYKVDYDDEDENDLTL